MPHMVDVNVQLRLSAPLEETVTVGAATGEVRQEFGGLYTVRINVGKMCVHSVHNVTQRNEAVRLQKELTKRYSGEGKVE